MSQTLVLMRSADDVTQLLYHPALSSDPGEPGASPPGRWEKPARRRGVDVCQPAAARPPHCALSEGDLPEGAEQGPGGVGSSEVNPGLEMEPGV